MSNPTLNNFDRAWGLPGTRSVMARRPCAEELGFFDVLPLISVYFPATTVAPFHGTGFISALPQGSFYAGGAALLGAKSGAASVYNQHGHHSYEDCSGTSMSSGN